MTRLIRDTGVSPQGLFATGHLGSIWTFLGALFFELWAVISALACRFVESLHETRRRQAAEIIRCHRDLMCNSDISTHKANCENAKKRKRKSR